MQKPLLGHLRTSKEVLPWGHYRSPKFHIHRRHIHQQHTDDSILDSPIVLDTSTDCVAASKFARQFDSRPSLVDISVTPLDIRFAPAAKLLLVLFGPVVFLPVSFAGLVVVLLVAVAAGDAAPLFAVRVDGPVLAEGLVFVVAVKLLVASSRPLVPWLPFATLVIVFLFAKL